MTFPAQLRLSRFSALHRSICSGRLASTVPSGGAATTKRAKALLFLGGPIARWRDLFPISSTHSSVTTSATIFAGTCLRAFDVDKKVPSHVLWTWSRRMGKPIGPRRQVNPASRVHTRLKRRRQVSGYILSLSRRWACLVFMTVQGPLCLQELHMQRKAEYCYLHHYSLL